MQASTAQLLFWVYAGVMGLSLASVFLVFTGESIARVFFITAGTFGAMSLYGYTTQRDLTRWGSFLFMGLIGIILASLVNIFLASSALQFAISVIGVIVFVGLTAYDTQQIKEMYFAYETARPPARRRSWVRCRLYLDFINLFMMLLQLFWGAAAARRVRSSQVDRDAPGRISVRAFPLLGRAPCHGSPAAARFLVRRACSASLVHCRPRLR